MSITKTKRHERICELLKEGKSLSVVELSASLSVSSMTIRRDLEALKHEGKLRRVRGWAEPVRTNEYEPSFSLRARDNAGEKLAISKVAAGLVKDGEVIIIDVGTTLLEFSRLIGQTKRVTVLTHWLPHALELAKYSNVHTIVLGGTLRHGELSLIGSMTGEALAGFNADRAFLNVGGISLEKGITDYNLDEVEIKRAIIQSAGEIVVVADHTKLGRVAPVRVAPLNAIDLLITDAGITDRQREAFAVAGVKVTVADLEGGEDHRKTS